MITITENTCYTKVVDIQITKNIILRIGIKTLKWLRIFFKGYYHFFEHSKRYRKRKFKSKGKYEQTLIKTHRIFVLIIGIIIKKTYDKRKVYTFVHHKRHLKQKTFIEKLKMELKQAIQQATGWKLKW